MYQAVFDATRSSLSNTDIGAAVNDAIRATCDGSYVVMLAQEAVSVVRSEMTRPSVLFRPKLSRDGNMWCALYGDNLHEGVAGFGSSPDAACCAFDNAWSMNVPSDQSNKGATA